VSLKASATNKTDSQTKGADFSFNLPSRKYNDKNHLQQMVNEVVRSPGKPLDSGTRIYMESKFGHDFKSVAIHNDATAASSANSLGAKAFASGSNIVFAQGEYRPHTASGKALLAHELAHVVQQTRNGGAPWNPAYSDTEADAAGQLVGKDGTVSIKTAAPMSSPQMKPAKKTHTQVIRDGRFLRVVEIDEQGRIVRGLAEIKAKTGVEPDPIDVIQEYTREGKATRKFTVPPGYEATTNKATDAQVETRSDSETIFMQEAAPVKEHERQLEQAKAIYYEYLSDFMYIDEKFGEHAIGSPLFDPSQAKYASEEDLLDIWKDPNFKEWLNRRRDEIFYEKIKQQNLEYLESIGGAETGYTPEEARKIVAARFKRKNARGVPVYDENTGIHIGFVEHVIEKKELGGAVGTVTRVYYDLEGKEMHREKPNTVLTPAAEVFQDLARNAPGIGYAINVSEIGLGESLNLRDRGRNLSNADVADRAISALPGGELARGGAEVITGVSLSGGKDLGRAWEGDPRLLTTRERAGKAIIIGTAVATAGVGHLKMKFGPKIGPKFRPPSDRQPLRRRLSPTSSRTWAPKDITVHKAVGGSGPKSRVGSGRKSVEGIGKDAGAETPQSHLRVQKAMQEPSPPLSRHFTPGRQAVGVLELEEHLKSPRPRSGGAAAAKDQIPSLPARRPKTRAPEKAGISKPKPQSAASTSRKGLIDDVTEQTDAQMRKQTVSSEVDPNTGEVVYKSHPIPYAAVETRRRSDLKPAVRRKKTKTSSRKKQQVGDVSRSNEVREHFRETQKEFEGMANPSKPPEFDKMRPSRSKSSAKPKSWLFGSIRNKAALSDLGIKSRKVLRTFEEQHHLLIQEKRDWFEAKGIDIDQYTVTLTQGVHNAIHTSRKARKPKGTLTIKEQEMKGWNKEWIDWIDTHQNASKRQIRYQMNKMRRKYKIQWETIAPYEKR
jgi:hypothetical protein